MPCAFDDSEIKEKLAAVLAYGDRKTIARGTGVHQTVINDNFNPDEPRHSVFSQTLRIACELHDINADRGERFMETLRDMYEESKPRNSRSTFSISDALADIGRTVFEVITDRLGGNNLAQQLTKMQAVGRLVQKIKSALFDEGLKLEQGRLTPEE